MIAPPRFPFLPLVVFSMDIPSQKSSLLKS